MQMCAHVVRVILGVKARAWPWWAYGVADTRYLKLNELSISISGMDASVALLEAFIVVMYFKGYRIMATWFALLMGSWMGWGQYYFYMGEIYLEFATVSSILDWIC